MNITTKGIAAAIVAGLATGVYAESTHVSPTEPTAAHRMQIVESLTRLAEDDPTDAAIRLKLALVLDSIGLDEEADWWRDDAANINPDLVNNGVLEVEGELSAQDYIVERGAGQPTTCFQPIGPDVIVGSLHDLRYWGTTGGVSAYSVGTTSCNVGDENLDWFSGVAGRHPVIAQNMFKWEPYSVGDDNGRFKQIGQSWLKHGFFALSQNLCCSCSGTSGSQLGVGCSDPYGAGLNGSFSELGPRSEVNPVYGTFPEPHSSPSGSTTLRGRIQVVNTEMDQDVAINAASTYVVDGHYVAQDDHDSGNANNNASYREISVFTSGNTHSIGFGGGTQREVPAIMHWGEIEPGVTYRIVDVPDDGRYYVAYNVSDNGDGTWRYEYAVYNFYSDDAAVSFSVPVPDSVNVTNISFNDVDSHSGEPYDNTDWSGAHNAGAVSWSAPAFSPSADRNAIRWGTLYNFGFDADTAPITVSTSLGQISGGSTPAFNIDAPEAGAPPCVADFNGDGIVDTADLGILIAVFDTRNPKLDLNGDKEINTADLGILIGAFGPCPM